MANNLRICCLNKIIWLSWRIANHIFFVPVNVFFFEFAITEEEWRETAISLQKHLKILIRLHACLSHVIFAA